MTLMRKPEMEVIRFSESDIVAASGGIPQTMTATCWGNGVNGDFKINYGGVEYGVAKRNQLKAALENNGQTINVLTSKGRETNVITILNHDYLHDDSSSPLSGFVWDSANNRWNTKQ